ncbi:MAG: PaaI family thioesterase [Candidatus Helarchaeota archaeon]
MDVEKLKEFTKQDNYFNFIGIKVLEIAEGKAVVRLKIDEKLTNFFNAGHGGAIYSLGDASFQLACNASADIEIAVALSTTLNYIKKVEAGEILTADAKVIASTKRTSITEIEITNEKNDLVAVFRGLAYLKRVK